MNYPVYFENSKGERRSIGEAFDLKAVFDLISTFLVEHNYESYYTRLSPSADEWEMQQLKDCMIKSEDKSRPCKHTVISFGTESINTSQVINNTGKVGIIVWIDRDALNRELNS